MIRRVVEAVELSSAEHVDAIPSPCFFSESYEGLSSHSLAAEKTSDNEEAECYDSRADSANVVSLSEHSAHWVETSELPLSYVLQHRTVCRGRSLEEGTVEAFCGNAFRNFRPRSGSVTLRYRSLPKLYSQSNRKIKTKPKRHLGTTETNIGSVDTCMTHAATEKQEVNGISCQTTEELIAMEVLVMPMVSDPLQIEVRVPASSLSTECYKILKKIVADNELVLLNIGKGKARYVVIRKKASLQQRQALEMEAALKAAEEARLRREKEEREEQAEMERLSEQPTHVTMAIQTMTEEEEVAEPPAKGPGGRGKKSQQPQPPPAQPQMNAAARRRARRQAAAKAAAKAAAAATLRKNRMVETDMQTCPPDYIICPWCTLDIAPEAQCGHEEVCRAGFKQRERRAKAEAQLAQHRLAVENARRRKQGLAPKKPTGGPSTTTAATRTRNPSRSLSRNRSRSRTRSVDAQLSAALKRQALLSAQLDRVHPNDVDGMVHATHRVCSMIDCPRLLGSGGGPCAYCKLLLCPQHRPPYSGHDCKLAPPPPPPPEPEPVNGKVSMACGEDCEERRLALRSRLRDKLKTLADKRQR